VLLRVVSYGQSLCVQNPSYQSRRRLERQCPFWHGTLAPRDAVGMGEKPTVHSTGTQWPCDSQLFHRLVLHSFIGMFCNTKSATGCQSFDASIISDVWMKNACSQLRIFMRFERSLLCVVTWWDKGITVGTDGQLDTDAKAQNAVILRYRSNCRGNSNDARETAVPNCGEIIAIYTCPKKTSTFLFFKNLCQKLNDFNHFMC